MYVLDRSDTKRSMKMNVDNNYGGVSFCLVSPDTTDLKIIFTSIPLDGSLKSIYVATLKDTSAILMHYRCWHYNSSKLTLILCHVPLVQQVCGLR